MYPGFPELCGETLGLVSVFRARPAGAVLRETLADRDGAFAAFGAVFFAAVVFKIGLDAAGFFKAGLLLREASGLATFRLALEGLIPSSSRFAFSFFVIV